MEINQQDQERYILAQNRVVRIKKFYKHLLIYLIVNIFLSIMFIVGEINDGKHFSEAILNFSNYKIWLYWGVGIVFQFCVTFGVQLLLGEEWEQKKINEYITKHKKNYY
ncbi:2TM domain-containing protein [Polaribacter tangerinus]|uniref:2TM domain-containing protein n=1 Tax=Polaribacter tangerinus TaxID=1920034 RepID=UPI000B4BE746|nr:2TM domain-containing protein [Polaribacter tangerinus]